MACQRIWCFLSTLVTVPILLAAAAHSQELEAIIGASGDQLCSLDGIPEGERRLLAPTREHRVHLYLRCTLKGRDEFERTVCCEHLETADKQAVGLCPTSPATEPLLRDLKQKVRC